MGQELTVVGKAEFDDLLKGLDRLQRKVKDLEAEVGRVSGKPLKIPTDPAEQELKELRAELKRVESAYERALRGVNFARVIAETDKTEAATRRLARANQNLAARAKQLIRFSKELPPELRKVATGLDRVEKEAEQAERAFRKLSASKKDVTGLAKSIGQLRTGVGALIAALGIRQLIRFGRALIGVAADAVEIKKRFDSLIPALRAFTGSTELAEEVADRLASTADRLKIPMADLIGPFLQITAATKETTLTLKEQSDLFESAILTVRAFGLSTEEAGRLVRGFAQVAGKGTLQMEELRQQIGEVAFNALPALAKALGKTVPQLIQAVTDRAIDAETALRGFAKGLREANEAAGLAQLDTLKGDLGAFARATEEAQRVLADGLEPGLRDLIVASTDFLVTNKELIFSLGELGSAALKGIGGLVKVADAAGLGLKAAGAEAREFGQALVVIGQGFRALGVDGGVLIGIGENIRRVGSTLTATTARAEEFVKKVTEGFRRILNEGAGTSEELLEQQKKNFREQAKAAGIAAEEITTIAKTVADKVGKIQEDSLKLRKSLGKLAEKDLEEFGKIRVETERRIAEAIGVILRFEANKFKELSVELLETAERAAAARIETERKATEENLKLFAQIREGASELAAERIARSAETSTKIEKIELELAEKIAKIQEEFLEKLLKPKTDRVKLTKEITEKIAKLEKKASDDIIKELERIAAASKKAADKRIADEKRIQAELDKSIDKLRQLTEEIAATGDEDGEGGGKIGQLVGLTKDLVEELEKAKAGLGELFGDPGTTKDPGEFLEESFADTATLLGGVTDQLGFYTDQLQTAGGDTEKLRDFTEDLEDAIATVRAEFESFGTTAKERLDIVLGGFEALVEQGQVTEESFRSFGTEIAEVLDTAGGSAEKAAGQVGELGDKARDLEGIGTAGEDAAKGIKKIGEEAEGTKTKVIELADGTKAIVNVAEELEEAGEKGAKGVKELGDAAKETAEPLKEVAAAAEKLQEPILDEDQVANLKAFGEAAAEAKGPVGELAEPVERIAAGALDLSVSLPVVTTALVAITPELKKLLGLLRDDPIDFAAIATQLQAISGPLAEIGLSLTTVTAAIVALPDPLTKVNESIGPLFKLIQTAAEDGSIAQVGAAFETIAEAAPKIPEPAKAFVAALETLVKLREQVVTTLADTATGLEEIGSEELRSDLEDLGTKLADIAKAIGEAATKTGAWKEALDPLQGVLQGTVTEAGSLATALRDDLNPELDKTETEAGEAADEVGRLKGEIGEAEQGVVKLGETMSTVSAQVVADFQAMTAAANEFAAAANAAAEAAAKINVPQARPA